MSSNNANLDNEIEDEKDERKPLFCISDDTVSNLVLKMMELGYFHNNNNNNTNNRVTRREKNHQQSSLSTYTIMDESCTVLLPSVSCTNNFATMCVTKNHLQTTIQQSLQRKQGRISLEHMAQDFNLSIDTVEQCAQDWLSTNSSDKVHLVQHELITLEYLHELCANQVTTLLIKEGSVTISHLARSVFSLPMEFTRTVLMQHVFPTSLGVEFITTPKNGNQLVTLQYQMKKRQLLLKYLMNRQTPTYLKTVVNEIEWDLTLLVNYVKELCDSEQIMGELHVDHCSSASTSSSGVYIPQCYINQQEQKVEFDFTTNGYVRSTNTTMSQTQLQACISKSFPNAIYLENSIIHPDLIVAPIQAAMEDCTSTVLDLSIQHTYIQDELKHGTSDIHELFSGNLPHANDCLLLSHGEALYIPQQMIQHITTQILPTVIETHAKDHAQQIATTNTTSTDDTDLTTITKPKKKGRKRSNRKQQQQQQQESVLEHVVPLTIVAKKIAKEYSDFNDIQEAHGSVNDVDTAGCSWTNDTDSDGPLYEFCKTVLYTKEFQTKCGTALQAELDTLQTQTVSRMQGATQIYNIESSFEDKTCFATACYMVQLLSKLPLSTTTQQHDDDNSATTVLQHDFLRNCAADFTKRITQYCLFKNGVEDGIFSYHGSLSVETTTSDNKFYMPVKTSQRSFPNTFLSCITTTTTTDNGTSKDPLKLLRELLPGNVGVALARMWILTGGENYQGGTKILQDGNEFIRPGSVVKFLSHVEEACLSMCGLPFKLLDKKSEKNLMFIRRKELTARLEEADDLVQVLELTMMLLFQQSRGMAVVCGDGTRDTLLLLLAKDTKKIPASVAKKLLEASSSIQSKQDATCKDLLKVVKSFGMSRDITKYAKDCSTNL